MLFSDIIVYNSPFMSELSSQMWIPQILVYVILFCACVHFFELYATSLNSKSTVHNNLINFVKIYVTSKVISVFISKALIRVLGIISLVYTTSPIVSTNVFFTFLDGVFARSLIMWINSILIESTGVSHALAVIVTQYAILSTELLKKHPKLLLCHNILILSCAQKISVFALKYASNFTNFLLFFSLFLILMSIQLGSHPVCQILRTSASFSLAGIVDEQIKSIIYTHERVIIYLIVIGMLDMVNEKIDTFIVIMDSENAKHGIAVSEKVISKPHAEVIIQQPMKESGFDHATLGLPKIE